MWKKRPNIKTNRGNSRLRRLRSAATKRRLWLRGQGAQKANAKESPLAETNMDIANIVPRQRQVSYCTEPQGDGLLGGAVPVRGLEAFTKEERHGQFASSDVPQGVDVPTQVVGPISGDQLPQVQIVQKPVVGSQTVVLCKEAHEPPPSQEEHHREDATTMSREQYGVGVSASAFEPSVGPMYAAELLCHHVNLPAEASCKTVELLGDRGPEPVLESSVGPLLHEQQIGPAGKNAGGSARASSTQTPYRAGRRRQ